MPFDTNDIWAWLDTVPDPEIPVISVVDLGVIRAVDIENERVTVTVTPTYSGCPAMSVISLDIETTLLKRGVIDPQIKTQIAPPWTTDWLSEKGRKRLEEYGIAPPQAAGGPAHCPLFRSKRVEKASQFSSTPCKAQWRWLDCLQPFDYFKCI